MTHKEDRTLAFAREASLGLPGSIKQVADFLLGEGTGIEQLTMAQIAARCYTSKPTLVRFAKQAGYAGWRDYRHDFLVAMGELERRNAERSDVDVNYPFGEDASPRDVVDRLVRIRRLALDEVEHNLDREALAKAADALLAAHDRAYLGAMHNHQWGKVFASNLALMGCLCRLPQTEEAVAVLRCFAKGDCVVVASYSGALGHLPMSLVAPLHERGVTIVAVTNSERSELADVADHVLSFAPHEHLHDKMGAFYSEACTSLILDALYASCYVRRSEQGRQARGEILHRLRGHIPEDFS